MSNEFASASLTAGQLNALVKNIMLQTGVSDPQEAVRLINSGECIISRAVCSWREEDGVIYFSVTSDGTTGPGWIERLEKKGFNVGDYVKRILRSSDFHPTSGVSTEIAIIKGEFFTDNERTTRQIRAEADKRKFFTPNPEVACLLREMFTDEELEKMGFYWIVVMHEPIKNSGGDPSLLSVDRGGLGRWLSTHCVSPGGKWGSL